MDLKIHFQLPIALNFMHRKVHLRKLSAHNREGISFNLGALSYVLMSKIIYSRAGRPRPYNPML